VDDLLGEREERMRVNTRDQIWKLPDLLEHFSRYIAIERATCSQPAPRRVAVASRTRRNCS